MKLKRNGKNYKKKTILNNKNNNLFFFYINLLVPYLDKLFY